MTTDELAQRREAVFLDGSAEYQDRLKAVFLHEPLDRLRMIQHALLEVFCDVSAYLELADGHRGVGVRMLGQARERQMTFNRENATRHLVVAETSDTRH